MTTRTYRYGSTRRRTWRPSQQRSPETPGYVERFVTQTGPGRAKCTRACAFSSLGLPGRQLANCVHLAPSHRRAFPKLAGVTTGLTAGEEEESGRNAQRDRRAHDTKVQFVWERPTQQRIARWASLAVLVWTQLRDGFACERGQRTGVGEDTPKRDALWGWTRYRKCTVSKLQPGTR